MTNEERLRQYIQYIQSVEVRLRRDAPDVVVTHHFGVRWNGEKLRYSDGVYGVCPACDASDAPVRLLPDVVEWVDLVRARAIKDQDDHRGAMLKAVEGLA